MKWSSILLAALAAAGLSAQNTAPAAQVQGGTTKIHHSKIYKITDETARGLKDVEEQAYEATDHAATIQVAATGPVEYTREFHAFELDALREDVNRMGAMMGRLEALAPDETGWQRQTVARTMPLLKDLAAATEAAIRFVNHNPDSKLTLPEYQQITRRLYDQSTTLWKELHDSVRLADLRERELRLRRDLNAQT